MRSISPKLYVLLSVMVGLLLTVSGVHAQKTQSGQQGQSQYEQSEQTQPQADDFSKSQIKSFVAARAEVDELRQEFQPKFQNAGDVDEAQELRKEFQKEAVQILDENGLDVQTYNSIVKGMDTNKELRKKIEQKMGQ